MIRLIVLFVGMAVFRTGMSQSILPAEYSYDANGNMVSDLNKDIVAIHYNTLNLPDTIAYADGRQIIYVYTAAGQKIRQQVLDAGGASVVARDYAGDLVYENGVLQEAQHEAGRVLLGDDDPEYQYHLKDHLGNVRMTITPAHNTTSYLATMESENAGAEEQHFSDMRIRSSYTPANHTAGGNEVLNIGPGVERSAGLSLAVCKGDVVYLEVYAYYENGTVHDEPGTPALKGTMGSLVSSMAAVAGSLVSGESAAGLLPSSVALPLMLLVLPDAGTEQIPAAYLNYALFDKAYAMVTAGFRRVTKRGAYAKELLTLGPLEVAQSGYLDIYLSNTGSEHRVYFDDLKIQHIAGPVVQEDSYDPFGLTLAGQHEARYGERENRYLYNGKEQQTDHNLNWYDYGARMYDPALGRWHAQDPLSEKYASWSPYQYVLNNPLKFVDPDGRDVVLHHNGALTPAQQKNVAMGLKHARSIATGKRIMAEAETSRDVVVHLIFTDDLGYDAKGKVLGLTRKSKADNMRRVGTRAYLDLPGRSKFHALDGLDVTKDFETGKDIYLVTVSATGDPYVVAEAILHEFEAHVNRDGEPPADPTLPYMSDEEREHSNYGASDAAEYSYGFSNGRVTVIPRASNARRGTTAYRVQQELAARKLEQRKNRRR